MDSNDEILELIRERRKELGITQAEMAAKLGISQSAYKDIEIGKTDLKVKTLQQIANILGIDFLDKRKSSKEQSLVVVNPENIYSDLNEMRRKQDEMDSKLDEILRLFKGKK